MSIAAIARAVWELIGVTSRSVNTTYWGGQAQTADGPTGKPAVVVSRNDDKTGYALTAGSYSCRASATQRGIVQMYPTDVTQTAAIATVTMSRVTDNFGGSTTAQSGADNEAIVHTRTSLFSTTAVQAVRNTSGFVNQGGFTVTEIF